jgi:hypothetical protein
MRILSDPYPADVRRAFVNARAGARQFRGGGATAPNLQRRENGQGKTARQPGNPEAQGGKVRGDGARVAVRQEGSIGCDGPYEAKVRPTTATFSRSFFLSVVDRPFPAGACRIVMDEEDIPGLSFLAFRRTAIMLYLPALSEQAARQRSISCRPRRNPLQLSRTIP